MYLRRDNFNKLIFVIILSGTLNLMLLGLCYLEITSHRTFLGRVVDFILRIV